MDKLPSEILVHVLISLPVPDRLNSALTCRRWARAMCTNQLLKDVALTIESAEQLKAAGADFEYSTEFWPRIGKNLRESEFREDCSCRIEDFVKILRACSRLECLNMIGLDLRLPEDFRCKEIQESFSRIRHLTPSRDSTAAVFAHLLRWMSNVTTVSLFKVHWESDFVNRLPGLLGENRLVTELDFRGARVGTEELGGLIWLCSATVEVLYIKYFVESPVYEAVGDCTNLRRPVITGSEWFSDAHMKKILFNNPGLTVLELRRCLSLTGEGLAPLHQLQEPRKLSFSYNANRITSAFLCSLRKIQSLQDIEFRDATFGGRVAEVDFLRSIASLPNIRTLCNQSEYYETERLEVILCDFKNLRELELWQCWDPTESDRMKLSQFKQFRNLTSVAAEK